MTVSTVFALVLLTFYSNSLTSGSKFETLKHCCDLGKNYAESGLKCSSFQTPIAGVAKEDEASCLISVDVCCKKQYREEQCEDGQNAAKSGTACASSRSDNTNTFYSDCCEACKIGMEAGNSGQSCQSGIGLGAMMDGAFEVCCKQTSTTTSTTKSTTEFPTSIITKSLQTPDDRKGSPSLPPLEGLCDIPDLCAHICIPTGDSYKCDCYTGYTLMADGISCKKNKRPDSLRCGVNNPCDQICTDTGVAIKCSCNDGYELASDKKTCKDIDECAVELHDCTSTEECVNYEGYFDCESSQSEEIFNTNCPDGYKFDGKLNVCDDINECEIELVCPSQAKCINTIGSFKCEEVELDLPKCPPGFYFEKLNKKCEDIDECISGTDDCNHKSQRCLNTKGNFTCIDKASKRSCPAGFKKNLSTEECEDIDECEEDVNSQLCGKNEMCVNELGGHTCVPKAMSMSSPPQPRSTQAPTKSTVPTTSTSPTTQARPTIEFNSPTQPPFEWTSLKTEITTTQQVSTVPPNYYKPQPPPNKRPFCRPGFRLAPDGPGCIDINECEEEGQPCDSNQNCYNTQGSFICRCKSGFRQDHTGACADINECQLGNHDCADGQRCDNIPGSYQCSRIAGCGTGYTLNSLSGLCEDDDECQLGMHNCNDLGPKFQCRNTLGSYRCEKIHTPLQSVTRFVPVTPAEPTYSLPNYPVISGLLKRCLPGYKMNADGVCEDINECESSPCGRGEKCLNLNGRYHCEPNIQCRAGYELNEIGDACIDINECARGTHKCKGGQLCKNIPGYYICQCPPGHKFNINNECEDINECEFYRGRICSVNAECINTIGSYKCNCKEGFRENGQSCDDIDECLQTSGLCHQNCVNLWGSYRCSCDRGFTLNSDNRTCTDVDECEKFKDRKLCIGPCENTPGSYVCKCPEGYRLGADGRTCQDIDECQRNPCHNLDDICFNTRGSYKCHTIKCPRNYIKDPDHRSRCKRASNICDIRDLNCINQPEQYSYHFVTFVSQLPIPEEGRIDFFQMKGPAWIKSNTNFNMDIVDVRCPHSVPKADKSYFRTKREANKVTLSVVRPIQGPQEIEIQLQMELYINSVFHGKVVSTIFIFVSEYTF